MTTTTTRYADLVARAVRICNAANVMDFNGHVSARDEGAPHIMWINNREASRSTLTANEIVAFDIDAGRRIGEGVEPPSEWHIHAEIYRRRPEARGIVHSHPEFIVTLSGTEHRLRPFMQSGSFLPAEGAPVFDSPVLINTPRRGSAMADALGDAPLVILRQHGAVAVGDCVEQAVVRMICAELNAKQLYQALQVGTPRTLGREELETMVREGGGGHATTKFWHYYEETARKAGAFEGL